MIYINILYIKEDIFIILYYIYIYIYILIYIEVYMLQGVASCT
jgi:hypothetical protein